MAETPLPIEKSAGTVCDADSTTLLCKSLACLHNNKVRVMPHNKVTLAQVIDHFVPSPSNYVAPNS